MPSRTKAHDARVTTATHYRSGPARLTARHAFHVMTPASGRGSSGSMAMYSSEIGDRQGVQLRTAVGTWHHSGKAGDA